LSNDRLGVVGKYDNGNYFPLAEGDISIARAFLTIMKLTNPSDIWSQASEMPAEHKPFDPAALNQFTQPQPQQQTTPFGQPISAPNNAFPPPGAPKQAPFPGQPQQSNAPFGQPQQSNAPFPGQPQTQPNAPFPGQPQTQPNVLPSTTFPLPNGLPSQPNGFPQPQQSNAPFPGQPQQSNAPFPGQPQQSNAPFPGQPQQSNAPFGQPQIQPNGLPQPQQSNAPFPGQPQQSNAPFPGQPQQSNGIPAPSTGFSVQAAIQEPTQQPLLNPKEEKVAVQQSNAKQATPEANINVPTQSS
jgi:hypothetical protein